MATKLESADKCIIVNGVLYPKGVLRACMTDDRLTIWEDMERTIPLIDNVAYDSIIHVNTGTSFTSASELNDFVKEHFFFKVMNLANSDLLQKDAERVYDLGSGAGGERSLTFTSDGTDATVNFEGLTDFNVASGNTHIQSDDVVAEGNWVFKNGSLTGYDTTLSLIQFLASGNVEISGNGSSYFGSNLAALFKSQYGEAKLLSVEGNAVVASTEADVQLDAGSDVSVNADTGNIYLSTQDTPRVYINHTGNVGVGTTSPTYSLDVASDAAVRGLLYLPNLSNASGDFVTFTGNALHRRTASETVTDLATPLGAAYFKQNGNSFGANAVIGTNDNYSLSFETNGVTRATIDTSGNLTAYNGLSAGTTSFPGVTILDGAGSGFTPKLWSVATSGASGLGVFVADGTNNRRGGLFVDNTNGVWGLSLNYSSSSIPFEIRYPAGRFLGISSSGITNASGSIVTIDGNNYLRKRTVAEIIGDAATTLDTSYYKQGGNSFGANGNIGTNDAYSFWLRTNGTIRGGFTSTGNFHIGSQGSGTSPYLGPISGASSAFNDAGKGLLFYNYYSSDGGGAYSFAFLGSTLSHTTGGNYNILSARNFSPTSGTGTFTDLYINSTINQTGGASGIVRSLYVAPIITAAADYRAIETATNTGLAFYAAGVASSRFNGSVGIGTSPATNATFHNLRALTGGGSSVAYQNLFGGVIQSDITSSAFYNRTQASTQATSFTLGNLYHYSAGQATIGAGSTITNQYGFLAENTLTGATYNYGFYGGIAAGTGRYNLYMAGTAQNYLGGNLAINGDQLQVSPYELHKTYSVGFANSVSNQKVDILLGNTSMDVAVDIIVSSSYSSANAAGYLHKRTYFGANPSNAIWGNNVGVRYVEASGTIVNEFAIGNIVWDATLSQYKLTVAHLTSFANQIAIYLVFRSKNTTAINNISSNISIGSVYTTDATVFPTAYVTFAAKTGFQSLANAAGDFATFDASGYIQKRTAAQVLGDISAQAQLNGTGFVKASGTTISYDNSTYINKLSTLATDASKTYGSTTGLEYYQNTTGSTNYPASAGMAVEFTSGNGTNSSSYIRDFTLYHSGSVSNDWYLRSYNGTTGNSNGFKRIWHAGDFTSTDISNWNAKIGGSGTASYIPKFTASGTIGNSQLYESLGNIGIGTASPGAKLSIEDGNIFVRNGADGIVLADNYASSDESGVYSPTGHRLAGYDYTSLQYKYGGAIEDAAVLTLTSGFKAGINNDNPVYTLHVTGDIALSSKLYMYDDANATYASLAINDYTLEAINNGITSGIEFAATVNRHYVLPDADGTIALQSWVSSNYQPALSGTGLLHFSGTTPSYLNSTTNGQVLRVSGGTVGFGSIDLGTSVSVGSTVLRVGNGGTGTASITGIVIGNGSSTMTAVTGTANQLLRRNAANTAYEFFSPAYLDAIPSWQNVFDVNATVDMGIYDNPMTATYNGDRFLFLDPITDKISVLGDYDGSQLGAFLVINNAEGFTNIVKQAIISDDNASGMNAHAALEISSTDKGLMLPRLETSARTSMSLGTSDAGLIVFDIGIKKVYYWDGTAWNGI